MLKKLWSKIANLFKSKKLTREIPETPIPTIADIPFYEESTRATKESNSLKAFCINILKSAGVEIPTDIAEREKRCIWRNINTDVSISVTRYKGKLFFIFLQEDQSGYRTHLYSSTITQADLY